LNSKNKQLNIFNEELQPCSLEPMTGFLRDGCCHTNNQDFGNHSVCALITQDFLDFSFSKGNDLITPRPEYDFPGLKPGDKWCLCANRWLEAFLSGYPTPVIGESTNIKALEVIDKNDLLPYVHAQ
jgi:uncharacterized protein